MCHDHVVTATSSNVASCPSPAHSSSVSLPLRSSFGTTGFEFLTSFAFGFSSSLESKSSLTFFAAGDALSFAAEAFFSLVIDFFLEEESSSSEEISLSSAKVFLAMAAFTLQKEEKRRRGGGTRQRGAGEDKP
jgi:hypothetical protein